MAFGTKEILRDSNSPCEDTLMVPGLGAVVSLHYLLPERAVLELDLVRVDGLQALVQDFQHAHQLSANLDCEKGRN